MQRWAYALYANNGTDPLDIPVAKHKTGPKGMPELAYIHNVWPEGVDYDQNHPIPDAPRAGPLGRQEAKEVFTDAKRCSAALLGRCYSAPRSSALWPTKPWQKVP